MRMNVGRKLYTLKEIYCIVFDGIRTAPYLSKAKRSNQLSPKFTERIMLAVTEVNGCAICSYAHTKMALERGMSSEEIEKMLSGVIEDLPLEEVQAIMVAQHYTDSRGKPSKETWSRILECYGETKAYGILAAIRIITMGNAYGIPWSSFFNRFMGKSDQRSSLAYELEVIILGSLYIPLAILHSVIATLLQTPIITFTS